MIHTKACSKCKEIKSSEDFNKCNKVISNRRSICKKCQRKQDIEYCHSIPGLISNIYHGQRHSSKKRKHPLPPYNKDEFKKWILSQEKFNLLYTNWVNSKFDKMLIPSVDRIDCDKPYSFDNIELMTWKDNINNRNKDVKSGKIIVKGAPKIPILQFDLNNNFIQEWESIAEANRQLGIHQGNICKILKGKWKTCGGFIWKYKT
ncbi:MAG: NUMOD1 domain-containing DNA-binding protein [Candidatus Omnitrophica bacterium]|jgi:hypothetical protein|nr:NUMOD1 domain-containing DNA-binding protein [Candidatus Omnitrophota bacterium]